MGKKFLSVFIAILETSNPWAAGSIADKHFKIWLFRGNFWLIYFDVSMKALLTFSWKCFFSSPSFSILEQCSPIKTFFLLLKILVSVKSILDKSFERRNSGFTKRHKKSLYTCKMSPWRRWTIGEACSYVKIKFLNIGNVSLKKCIRLTVFCRMSNIFLVILCFRALPNWVRFFCFKRLKIKNTINLSFLHSLFMRGVIICSYSCLSFADKKPK